MKNICAIWDIPKAGSGLGSFLLFQEELLLYRDILRLDGIDLFFFTGSKEMSSPYLADLARFNPFIRSMKIMKDKPDILNDRINSYGFIWPSTNCGQNFSYNESTLHIRKLWKQTGNLLCPESPSGIRAKATSWMQTYIPPEWYPIAVHLKNGNVNKQSNANQTEWLKFFEDCRYKKLPVIFILIGNDFYDKGFNDCPNCIITQQHGGYLGLDLSLIQMSLLFMGMSSGPCNMAVLSDLPYLIWKHPDHHTKKMNRELNSNGQFPFANDQQKIIRENDCLEALVCQFAWLFNKVKNLIGKGKPAI